MKDHKYLQVCLSQIEKELEWGKSEFWKESEFLQLSEIIFKRTEISISPHTLKRLYGKIKYKEHYNPQRATKDALAKFIGYHDWIAFTNSYDQGRGNQSKRVNIYFSRQKKTKILLFLLTGIVIFFIFQSTSLLNAFIAKKANRSFLFNTIDTIATVPYTVSVEYDITNIPSDSLYADFGFDHPITGPEVKKLDKKRSLINYTYQIPGYYRIELNNKGRVLSSKNVLVTSENWFTYYYPEERQVLWLNNQIKNREKEGYLYYSPESLKNNGLDIRSVYFLENQIFKDFEINGDNFEMALSFKNSKEIGGISCYDFVLTLLCEKNFSQFKLMEQGCSGYSGVKVGELELNGTDEELSSLTFDPNCWNNLRVVVKDQTVQVLLNKKVVFFEDYIGSNGNIVGIEQLFKGSGSLDFIYITDLGTGKKFFDDFD